MINLGWDISANSNNSYCHLSNRTACSYNNWADYSGNNSCRRIMDLWKNKKIKLTRLLNCIRTSRFLIYVTLSDPEKRSNNPIVCLLVFYATKKPN